MHDFFGMDIGNNVEELFEKMIDLRPFEFGMVN